MTCWDKGRRSFVLEIDIPSLVRSFVRLLARAMGLVAAAGLALVVAEAVDTWRIQRERAVERAPSTRDAVRVPADSLS